MLVGADRVTIDSTRVSPVWVNGAAAVFTSGKNVLPGGVITQTSSGYVVALSTGETVTANIFSYGAQSGPLTTSYGINTSIALKPFVENPRTIQGLLGNLNGDPSKDLTLADGTVLPTNMPTSELYGAYADSWRLTQAASLLDYGPGQTTATFTDRSYPGTPISVASFPEAAIQMAAAVVAQMGITDPGLRQDAIYDYLVTGNRALLTSEANLQQQGVTTSMSADPTPPAPPPEAGIIAAQVSETEAATGPTTVQFMVYRSGDVSAAATVSYAVVAPDGAYVGASSFGGALPSGTVSFAAGQISAVLPITLTSGIGDAASKTLQVRLSADAPVDIIGQTAQVQIVNPAPVAGPAPAFGVELVGDPGLVPTHSGDTWTFDLGTLRQALAATSLPITLAVMNTAGAAADLLSGTVAGSGASFTSTVSPSFQPLMGGAIQDVASLTLDPNTFKGGAETLTIALTETNASGFTEAPSTQTVTIQIEPDLPCFAAGTRLLTVAGERPVEQLRVGDRLLTAEGAERAVVWLGHRTIDLARHPDPEAVRPIRIAAGAIDDTVPRRDLVVSPDHAVLAHGMLVPARLLLNGATVRQDVHARSVTYFHVELSEHALLMAEGMPAESYLDTGNRAFFAGPVTDLRPTLAHDPARRSLPLDVAPDRGRVAWEHVAGRARARGHAVALPETTDDAELRLLAGPHVLRPAFVSGLRHVFAVPPDAGPVRLASRAGRPSDAEPWHDDRRPLGVNVARMTLRGPSTDHAIALDGPEIGTGWWPCERAGGGPRWTAGDAAFAMPAEGGVLEITLAGTAKYAATARPTEREAA